MYLENSEQGKVGGEGELSAGAILSGQCAVSKVTGNAGLSSSSKGSVELDIKALVEYPEQSVGGGTNPPLLCVEHCSTTTEQTGPWKDCDGLAESFEEYLSSNGLFESDQALEETECTGLSRLYDECTQHCECFQACKSSEHCANHSFASESSLCCEHCQEHLPLFPPCKPSDQQSDFSDYEPDKLEVNSDGFGESEVTGFESECTENLNLPLDSRCEDSDLEQDGSTEDSEQYFTQNISGSMESLACAADFSEYDGQAEAEYTDDDGDEEESIEHSEIEVSDEESSTLSEDTPDDPCESDAGAEENYQHTYSAGDGGELQGDDSDDELSRRCNFEDSVESRGDEDLSSDDSTAFKICLNVSFPSDPSSSSSEESDKAAQDGSNDEPMQWESFEENDAEKPPSTDESGKEDKNKTSAVDAYIEDYFDLFDRGDCFAQVFAQKRHYISCFDGGDIQNHLHLEQEAEKQGVKSAQRLEETNEPSKEQETDVNNKEDVEINTLENDEQSEDSEERVLSQRDSRSCGSENQCDDWTLKSESSSTKDEAEDNESETFGLYPEYYEESEEDEVYYDYEAWGFEGNISDEYDEDDDFYLDSCRAESMFGPCAKEIFVEGEIYEDDVSAGENNCSVGEADSETTSDLLEDNSNNTDSELDGFPACSETEPYLALIDTEENGECCPSGVEDYYAYQIKSIQSSGTQPLNRFTMRSGCTDRSSKENVDRDASRSESEPEKASGRLGIAVVTLIPNEQGSEPDNELLEVSDLTPPLGIIHSVVSTHEATQSRDSEEEQSEDESIDYCECEYCVPSRQQVKHPLCVLGTAFKIL